MLGKYAAADVICKWGSEKSTKNTVVGLIGENITLQGALSVWGGIW